VAETLNVRGRAKIRDHCDLKNKYKDLRKELRRAEDAEIYDVITKHEDRLQDRIVLVRPTTPVSVS
jgi:hypothetical protein